MPFEDTLVEALQKRGIESWLLYWKVWCMKALYNFTSRKFQALILSFFICWIFNADTWIILSLLATYAGANIAEKFKRPL